MNTNQSNASDLEIKQRVKLIKELITSTSKRNLFQDPSDLLSAPDDRINEIFTNCYLGDVDAATNKPLLRTLGITHILNAAKGEKDSQVNTNQLYYNDIGIKFYGCPLMDVPTCKIESYFEPATEFMHEALQSDNGKILVHCLMGVSRSASFVIAYLMRYHKMRLEVAATTVAKKRLIWPNDGFIRSLIEFEKTCTSNAAQ